MKELFEQKRLAPTLKGRGKLKHANKILLEDLFQIPVFILSQKNYIKKIWKIQMEVIWKVFSCERNQYWFEKQLQGTKGEGGWGEGEAPCQEIQNLIYSSRKIGVTQVRLVNEQSSEFWLLSSKHKVEIGLSIFAFFEKLPI